MDKLCRGSLRCAGQSLGQGVWLQCAIQRMSQTHLISPVALTRGRYTSSSAPVFVINLCQPAFLHPVLMTKCK